MVDNGAAEAFGGSLGTLKSSKLQVFVVEVIFLHGKLFVVEVVFLHGESSSANGRERLESERNRHLPVRNGGDLLFLGGNRRGTRRWLGNHGEGGEQQVFNG